MTREPNGIRHTNYHFMLRLILLVWMVIEPVFAETHNWVLKSGKTISGAFVSSGSAKMVLQISGTNCLVNISDLNTNQLIYIEKMKIDQRLARYDLSAKQLASIGYIEVDAKTIQNFPEKVDFKNFWMDAKFRELDNLSNPLGSDTADYQITISVWDKNKDLYSHIVIKKLLPDLSTPNPLISQFESVKKGDLVRFVGVVHTPVGSDYDSLDVSDFSVMETSEEIKAMSILNE